MNNRIIKKRVIILIVFLLFILFFIANGYITGIKIYKAVKYSILTDKGYDDYVSRYMSSEIFDLINLNKYYSEPGPFKKKLDISMLFSINDFFRNGIVWMKYTLEIRDRNNKLLTSAGSIPMLLILKKEGAYWRIVMVSESP